MRGFPRGAEPVFCTADHPRLPGRSCAAKLGRAVPGTVALTRAPAVGDPPAGWFELACTRSGCAARYWQRPAEDAAPRAA